MMRQTLDQSLSGFTILELLLGLTLALITIGAASAVYILQQRHYDNQQLRHTSWHNLWGAILVMEQEIRKAGYDPEGSGAFSITDVRRYDPEFAGVLDANGQPVLFYTCDLDEDGGLDQRNNGRNREQPKFRISDLHNTGNACLTWDNGSGRRPLADQIHAMGFAFALDADQDGRLDTAGDSQHLIWAVDSNNDNLLDMTIDTNNDGVLDENDDANGDGRIDLIDGGRLDHPLPLKTIRVVKVWLMAQTQKPIRGTVVQRKYLVGDRIYTSHDEGMRRFVVASTIVCRNL